MLYHEFVLGDEVESNVLEVVSGPRTFNFVTWGNEMTNVLQFKCSNEEIFIKPINEKQVIEMYGLETVPKPIESNDSIDYLIKAFANNRAEMERLKILESELRDNICSYMGKHDTLVDKSGQKLVQWTYKKGAERFDREGLKNAHPELEKRFTKTGEPCRAFSVLVKVIL